MLPTSTKTPQVTGAIIFGSSGAAPSAAARKILLIGSIIASALTATINISGSTTSTVTTAAGIAALDRATRVTSPDHAATLGGRGSELHLGAIAAFAQYRQAEVWIAPVTAHGSTISATAVITPTLGTLAAGTLRITVCGRSVDIGIAADDTVSTIGRKMATAINEQLDWPCTATNVWATGATTLTAKIPGPRGNALTVRAALITSTATTEVLNGTAGTAFGLTITLSGGTASGGVYRFSGGANDDDVAALVATLSTQKFDRIVFAGYSVSGSASANLAALTADVATRSTSQMADQQLVFGSVETYGTAITRAQGLNAERAQWVCHPGADDLPIEIGAQVAAARLFGDAVAGGTIRGEASEPAGNLNGLELATLRAPRDPADLLDATETELALNGGVTPLGLSPTRPGRMAVVASIVTRCLSGAAPDFSVYKTKDVVVADWVRAEVVASLRNTYRGFNLVADVPSGAPPLAPRTTSPKTIEERLYALLKGYEARGILRDVTAKRAEVAVTRNATNPRRVDFTFPTIPPQDFDIADGTIYQRQPE